jgi:hypothetical protein
MLTNDMPNGLGFLVLVIWVVAPELWAILCQRSGRR